MNLYSSGFSNLKYDFTQKNKNAENANNEQNLCEYNQIIDQQNMFKDNTFLEIKKKIDLMNKKISQVKNSFGKFEEIKFNQEKTKLNKDSENIISSRRENNASFAFDNYFLKNSSILNYNSNKGAEFLNCNNTNNINDFEKKHNISYGTFDNYFLNRYDNYIIKTSENIKNNNIINTEENIQQINKKESNENIENNEYFKNKKDNMNNEEHEIEKTYKIYMDNNQNNSDNNENVNENVFTIEKIIKEGKNSINNIFLQDPIDEENKEKIENKKIRDTKNILTENNNETKNKKNKKIVFCEKENITIKYDEREKITEITIYNSLGKKLHFIPKNMNVYLNKLKKVKLKSILTNVDKSNNCQKNKDKIFKQTPKKSIKNPKNRERIKSAPRKKKQTESQEKKLNKTETQTKITPKKKLHKTNTYQKLQNKVNIPKINKKNIKIEYKKEKISEKFRSTPHKLYTEKFNNIKHKSFNIEKNEILTTSLSERNYVNNSKNEGGKTKKVSLKTLINTNKQKKGNKEKKKNKDDSGIDRKAFNNLKKYFEENNYSEEEKEKK